MILKEYDLYDLKELLQKFDDYIYIEFRPDITEKTSELLGKIGIKIINYKIFDKKKLNPNIRYFVLFQTSCPELSNILLMLWKLENVKSALLQDGFRLQKRGLKNFAKNVIDYVFPTLAVKILKGVYFKSIFDFYLIDTKHGYKDLLSYDFLKRKRKKCILIFNKNGYNFKKNCTIEKVNNIVIIDQPVNCKFREELYLNVKKNNSNTHLFSKLHPLQESEQIFDGFKNIKSIDRFSSKDTIFITFYSTLGFDLLKEGYIVLFYIKPFLKKLKFGDFFLKSDLILRNLDIKATINNLKNPERHVLKILNEYT